MKKNKIDSVAFIILAGRKDDSCLPAMQVERARQMMVLDLLDKIKGIGLISRIIISSNDEVFLKEAGSFCDRGETHYFKVNGSFSFGSWLFDALGFLKSENVFYFGAGASPFITAEIIESICASIVEDKNILYTNNFFSSDFVAFTPASEALLMDPPPLDNNLAYYLWQHRAFRSIYLEPSVEIVGDVDTPADLPVLALCPKTGPNTARYVKSLGIPVERMEKFCSLLKSRHRIFLSGRVGSSLFKYLDTESPCSFRIISEERGMRAFGRQKEGRARSFLGRMIEMAGIDETFKFIEDSSDGAVIDSRVIFSHIVGNVDTEDRFYSDLYMPEKIKNPFVAEFTQRARMSKIPILLGGHSLILGGMWALVSAFGKSPAFY